MSQETEQVQEVNPDQMTREEILMVQKLRDRGFAIVIWHPEELENVDVDYLEEIVIERGNNFIESCAEPKEENA